MAIDEVVSSLCSTIPQNLTHNRLPPSSNCTKARDDYDIISLATGDRTVSCCFNGSESSISPDMDTESAKTAHYLTIYMVNDQRVYQCSSSVCEGAISTDKSSKFYKTNNTDTADDGSVYYMTTVADEMTLLLSTTPLANSEISSEVISKDGGDYNQVSIVADEIIPFCSSNIIYDDTISLAKNKTSLSSLKYRCR